MRSRLSIFDRALCAAVVLSVAVAAPSAGFDMPPDSTLRVGGRLDYRIESAWGNKPFTWNYASRSVGSQSRLMLDLFTGGQRYGELYLKGNALWNQPRTTFDDVRFEFDQGDYLWTYARGDTQRVFQLRLFANERRYFTGELSAPILYDDVLSLYDDQFGFRHDGEAGDFAWTALAAVLGDTWDDTEKFYYLRAGWFADRLQLSAAYRNDAPAADSLQNHAILKGEVSAAFPYVGAAFSYEQSGFEDRAFFLPSGDDDGTRGFYPDSDSPLPEASAVFAELRAADVPVEKTGLWSFVYRYRMLGDAYVNNLAPLRPGTTTHIAAVYYAARKQSIDGRLVYRRWTRTRWDDKKFNQLEASARGMLNNGFDMFLRGVYDTMDDAGQTTRDRYLHAALNRHGRKIYSGLHVMFEDASNRSLGTRLGVAARFNFNATVALYGRIITGDRTTGSSDAYWRLETRPTDWMFATLGYGREYIGDDPFLLEDPDIGRRPSTEAVYFLTVRGDF